MFLPFFFNLFLGTTEAFFKLIFSMAVNKTQLLVNFRLIL
uniref:Uncharacterized protein n=1 Tax=Rhizophora mucronata TaxID=61149 RepID=A0A2P2Q0U5_RHIMU